MTTVTISEATIVEMEVLPLGWLVAPVSARRLIPCHWKQRCKEDR